VARAPQAAAHDHGRREHWRESDDDRRHEHRRHEHRKREHQRRRCYDRQRRHEQRRRFHRRQWRKKGMSSDHFAKTNGCTVETMPMPPAGGHVCTDYKGCSPGFPVRWCDYDGDHTPSPADSGQKSSWVPAEVWNFIKQY
jgi:hypothetical protein